ncbi:MAG TPA: hypothetical protein DDW62_12335 [Marinilabiliaceae bacterium]|jgi:hypothetical protein|nr:hypothetical protein [Marinilabiliaceae bacterium]
MDAKLLSIKPAAKLFGISQAKMYQLVEEGRCPYVGLENLSGHTSRMINTKAFADWLDEMAEKQMTI